MTVPAEKHQIYDKVLRTVKAGVMPYVVGPAGCGKTTLGKQVAKELGINFFYTGAVDSPFQLRGFMDAQGRTVRTPFRDAYENGGLFLFDELDASDPKAIVSMHAALDNGVLDAPDGMVERHENFRCIAAANTWGNGATLEYVGRNALDGATLDRYAFMRMDYDPMMEKRVVAQKHPKHISWVDVVQSARAAANELGIRLIISPRASFNGAALLSAGFEKADVVHMAVLKHASQDDAQKIIEHMAKSTVQIERLTEVQKHGEELKSALDQITIISEQGEKLVQESTEFFKTFDKTFGTAKNVLGNVEESLCNLKKVQEGMGFIERALARVDGYMSSVRSGKYKSETAKVGDTVAKQGGIYLGQWEPKVEHGNSLKRIFDLYAAPHTLPAYKEYAPMLAYIAELKKYNGFDGSTDLGSEEAVLDAVHKNPEKLESWWIPTHDVVNGSYATMFKASGKQWVWMQASNGKLSSINLHDGECRRSGSYHDAYVQPVRAVLRHPS